MKKSFGLGCVSQLTMLKFFPSDPLAKAKIAQIIEGACTDAKHAQATCDRLMAEHDEWPGPATLVKIAKRQVSTAPELVDYEIPWEPPTDLCSLCESWGHVMDAGRYTRCSCASGVVLDQSWLDRMNAKLRPVAPIRAQPQAPAATVNYTPITQADIDALLRGRGKM